MKSQNQSLYLGQQHQNSQKSEKIIIPLKSLTENQQRSNIKKSKFFLELQNQDEYSFSCQSQTSKKSKKNTKIMEKHQKSSFLVQKRQGANISTQKPPFEDDISSISYLAQQCTPQDSVYYKLTGTQQFNQHEPQCMDEKFHYVDQQFSQNQSDANPNDISESVNESMCNQQDECNNSSMMQPQDNNQEDQQAKSPQHKIKPIQNEKCRFPTEQLRNDYTFKSTALRFQKVNRFIKNFLKKKPDGIPIHPEYSTVLEDCSQLGIQGQTVMMKLQFKQNQRHENISSNKNNLKQFNDLNQFKDQRERAFQGVSFLKQFFDSQQLQLAKENKIQLEVDQKNKFQQRQKLSQNQEDTIGFKTSCPENQHQNGQRAQ